MSRPVITFDLDGVFANFTRLFTSLVNAKAGTSYSENWKAYWPSDLPTAPMTIEHFNLGVEEAKALPFFWARLEAYPGIPFDRINTMMHEVAFTGYVVTKRIWTNGGCPANETRIWLQQHGLTDLQGVIVGDQDRIEAIHLLNSDAHLDDSGDNVRAALALGYNAFLLDQPWNQDANVADSCRVSSVWEFMEKAVKPLISEEASEHFFSSQPLLELVNYPDSGSPHRLAELVRETGFQFSNLSRAS